MFCGLYCLSACCYTSHHHQNYHLHNFKSYPAEKAKCFYSLWSGQNTADHADCRLCILWRPCRRKNFFPYTSLCLFWTHIFSLIQNGLKKNTIPDKIRSWNATAGFYWHWLYWHDHWPLNLSVNVDFSSLIAWEWNQSS